MLPLLLLFMQDTLLLTFSKTHNEYRTLSAPEHEGMQILLRETRAGRNVNLKCIIHKDSGSYLYI